MTMTSGAVHSTTAIPAKRGRFAVNIVANTLQFVIQTAILILFTPYLIRTLGWGVYGLIPLINSMTAYITLVTLSFNSAVGRFITVAIEQDRNNDANAYFNTSLFSVLSVVSVFAVANLFLAVHADKLIKVPTGLAMESRWFFFLAVTAVLLMEVSAVFDVATYCRNRFDLRNAILIGTQLMGRILIILILFSLFKPRLAFVGIGLVVTALLALTSTFLVWRKLLPMLYITLHAFQWHVLRQIIDTSGWIIINQIGTLFLLCIDLIVVNRLYGPVQSGPYATLAQISAALRSFAGVMANIFAPTIIMHFARGHLEEMILYTRRAIKFLGLIMALPIGILCGLAHPFLVLWLHKPEAGQYALLFVLMIFHLTINLGYLPLHNIPFATNNVRLPGIVQIIAGVLNLCLAVIFAKVFGWGIYGVAFAGVLVLSLRNLCFTPYYASYIIKQHPLLFLREVLPLGLVTLVLSGCGWLISLFIPITSTLRLLMASGVLMCVYLVIVWGIVLTSEERRVVRELLPVQFAFLGKVNL